MVTGGLMGTFKITGADNTEKQIRENAIRLITTGDFKGEKVEYSGVTHYKYLDCKPSNLVTINGMKVHKDLATAFKKMQTDAKADGVNLNIVSAYRSTEYQKVVFPKKFSNKKNPTEEQFISRLKFSAPPGFSEHHTGLAIDINSTEQTFANTKAYKWLKEHASEYGFEMSFPQGNKQGLGFEPWHWRFVGTSEARQTFAQARK